MIEWLPRLVARIRATVHAKLLAAFLAIIVLLLASSAVALQALAEVNRRAEDMGQLQRKIGAYRQLNHDTVGQLYSVASALLKSDQRGLDATLRQLKQFGYDLDRLQFLAKDEIEVMARVRADYEEFIKVVTRAIGLIRNGKPSEGRDLQLAEASPLADRLERLTNELVNKAEAGMVAGIDTSHAAYVNSQRAIIAVAVTSIVLALLLGYGISVSIINPVKSMETRMREIAAGEFTKRVEVPNRDELGALATDLNRMSDELGRLYGQIEARNQELTESLEQQTATSDILRVISQSQSDVQPVFETIAANAQKLCGATGGWVRTFDGELIRIGASHGFGPEALEALHRDYPMAPSRRGATGRAILTRSVVYIPDIREDAEYEPHEKAQTSGIRSLLSVPMLREGSPIGAISVSGTEPAMFSERQIAMLQTFADQAVIAVENTRLFNELQARTQDLSRSVERLRSLAEVSQAVNSSLDLDKVLTTIVERAVQLSSAEGGVLYELDEASGELRPRATLGYPAEFADMISAKPLLLGESVVGRAAAARAPVEIPDITVDPGYTGRARDALERAGFHAVLAVPLLQEGRVIGGLGVGRRRAGSFSLEVIDMLQTFAAQSTLAIQNARLFREIEEKSRELAIASQHKSEFLANMSHELRTPLNAIIGFSEVLKDGTFGELNAKQDEYMQDVHASGHHLLSLINDILDLSKVEAGRMELLVSAFDLPEAIDNAVTLVRERAARHRVALQVQVDELLNSFTGDERKFKQILLNLLSNAVKFTPEGGQVTVAALPTQNGVQVSVRDTGIGIASEHQQAIFEAFRQVHGGHAITREGTGLGLTLVKQFVEMHGGHIWLESAPNKGSVFTFTLAAQPWQDS